MNDTEESGQGRPSRRGWIARYLGGGRGLKKALVGAFAVVALGAVIAGIAALTDVAALARHSGALASGYGVTATPFATITLKCGTSTTPNCPTAPPDPSLDWITIPADTPANVLTAFQLSSIYLLSQNGSGDGRLDLSRPETPVFVLELHAPGGLVLPDVWVISFDGSDGMMGYIAVCDINDAHTAVRCGSVAGGPARPHGHLALFSQAQAVSMVEAQSHVTLRPGAHPYLVYAPIDATLIETGQVVWTGGGSPGNPLWLVPCSDGKDRVVGIDGKVYLPSQIPVVKAH